MDECDFCSRGICRECGVHYCCEPCECGRSHNCACECRDYDHYLTNAD